MVEAIAKALGADIEPVWIDAEALLAEGLDGAIVPLWSEGVSEGVMALDGSAAQRTGLTPRPVAETIRDTRDWMATAEWRRDGSGLAPEREAELLDRLGG